MENLLPGGVILVQNSNYWVHDSAAFADLEPIETPVFPFSSFISKFSRAGQKEVMLNARYAVAVRMDDYGNPFTKLRHSLFVRRGEDQRYIDELRAIYQPPVYELFGRPWHELVSMRAPDGWRSVPYERVFSPVRTKDRLGLLKTIQTKIQGKPEVIGCSIEEVLPLEAALGV